jgi:hypothetical protein
MGASLCCAEAEAYTQLHHFRSTQAEKAMSYLLSLIRIGKMMEMPTNLCRHHLGIVKIQLLFFDGHLVQL